MARSEDICLEIQASGLSIADALPEKFANLKIPDRQLERILNEALVGMNVEIAARTRSKEVKSRICKALGYPVPTSFGRIPNAARLPGQDIDPYVQKSNNLQIWNQKISPERRYVLIFVANDHHVSHVTVLNGETLALYDKTGTLTKKYQASLIAQDGGSKLHSAKDTDNLSPLLAKTRITFSKRQPTGEPKAGEILSIRDLYGILQGLVGATFPDPGIGKERVRGGALHQLVCKQLGYSTFADNGQLPDILDQLVEIKLQLAKTVDLGLVLPNSNSPVTSVPVLNNRTVVHSDLRYAVFDAQTTGQVVTVTRLSLVAGHDFFSAFRRFEGNVSNQKLQLCLPKTLTQPPT